MLIYNADIGGRLKSVKISDGKIEKIAENTKHGDIDAHGNRLVSGLIDIHTHGCMGMDTMDADFEKMCKHYADHGTTSFLPTTMTMGYDALKRVTTAKTDFSGAEILGFHFEGPYISVKRKGAQNERYIKNPSAEEFSQFENVKMVTLAPELEGAEEFIKQVSPYCAVSIGHTDCDYETALNAIDSGASCLTHIYNAMPPLHHRNSGPIGAAIEKNIYAQLICDGLHIAKPVVLATYRAFTPDKLILISDSIRSAGLPDGKYDSGGLQVTLKNGVARLRDGTLAGSSSMLIDCVKTAVKFGIPFDDALKAASENPARLLGLNKGKVAEGYDADLLIIDDEINIKTVIIGGKIYKNEK